MEGADDEHHHPAPHVPPGGLERAAPARADSPGERGFDPPATDLAIAAAVGDGVSAIPAGLRRSQPPALPELSQGAVLRHFLRLSQETLGSDINIQLGLGTCTMKYSPKVNEALVRSHKVTQLHPWQDDDASQGILEAMYRFERILCEISGMDRFTFQPGGGTQAVYANAGMIRAYHAARGQEQRDEIITTVFSHPCDGAGPATAGYKVDHAVPGRRGCPESRRSRRPLSERTAGLMITNPEDTGIFNPHIEEIVEVVHDAGGICHYDQANANGILGITRARDAGFDLCQFNLHKTFSSPHCLDGHARRRLGSDGGAGAVPAVADGGARRRAASISTTTGPSRSGRCAPSTGCRPPSCGRTHGCCRSAPRVSARWPRSRC